MAVDRPSLFVDGQAAVRIAVKGNAEVVSALPDSLAQPVQMGRAAAVVDVHAVRLVVQIVRLQRETAE